MKDLSPTEATEVLFKQYGDSIYRFVRFTLGKSEVEDGVQEIFTRVFTSWTKFRHECDAKTWLWRIADNYTKSELRKLKSKRLFSLSSDYIELQSTDTVDPLFYIDLERNLRLIGINQRKVVILRIIHDMSTEEVASILGWSQSKVRVTLHRALKRLALLWNVREELDTCGQI